MGAHIVDGEFQSDKYPTTPRGKVPLSVKDKTAQDLLWEYAQRRRAVDAEFSADLETALRDAGYVPGAPMVSKTELDAALLKAEADQAHDEVGMLASLILQARLVASESEEAHTYHVLDSAVTIEGGHPVVSFDKLRARRNTPRG